MIGIVTATAGILDSDLGINNDIGGSCEMPPGEYRVELERSWHDYEIGGRAAGRLLDEADIAKAREVGTTGYATPEKITAWDPARVFFPISAFKRW